MFCGKCGTKLEYTAKKCPNCGEPVVVAPVTNNESIQQPMKQGDFPRIPRS